MMTQTNRVTVKIYGQTYTIAGDAPREYIVKIADYVNARMEMIAKQLGPGMATQVAVLSAVNIGEELFGAIEERDDAKGKNKKLMDEAENVQRLWEESKNGFLLHKQEIQKHMEQSELAQTALGETKQLLEKTREEDGRFLKELQDENKVLKEAVQAIRDEKETTKADIDTQRESLEEKIKDLEGIKQEMQAQIKAFMAKEQEVETNFFDVQMENVQLKSELEKYKRER